MTTRELFSSPVDTELSFRVDLKKFETFENQRLMRLGVLVVSPSSILISAWFFPSDAVETFLGAINAYEY